MELEGWAAGGLAQMLGDFAHWELGLCGVSELFGSTGTAGGHKELGCWASLSHRKARHGSWHT